MYVIVLARTTLSPSNIPRGGTIACPAL